MKSMPLFFPSAFLYMSPLARSAGSSATSTRTLTSPHEAWIVTVGSSGVFCPVPAVSALVPQPAFSLLEACGVFWDCVSEWACAPPQPARSKASMTTIIKVFTGARTLSFRAPTRRLLPDVLRRSSTRVGGAPIWSRTNCSTCWCHLAGSPMIAGAHSREDGDVRCAVHYGTFSHEEPPSETPSRACYELGRKSHRNAGSTVG